MTQEDSSFLGFFQNFNCTWEGTEKKAWPGATVKLYLHIGTVTLWSADTLFTMRRRDQGGKSFSILFGGVRYYNYISSVIKTQYYERFYDSL